MSLVDEMVMVDDVDGMKPMSMWNADMGNGRYKNPILYGDYSDPDAIRVGSDYYMVASSFCNAPGLPLLHSNDLVNWRVVNYVIDEVPGERYKKPIHGCGVWAPSIRYHDGTFFVCFPMPDEGIFMCTTKNPYGKWSKPVNIRPGAGWIDPCPFWDEDGNAYLVAGVAKSRIGYKSVLHMVRMQPDGMGVFGKERVVFDGNLNDQVTIEGPKLYKRNGWYYIFAPAGGVKTGWQTVLRSRDIFGPYEYRVVMRQGGSPVNGPHQGAWVDTVTGQDWFLHFQDVYAAGRIVHLQPMGWGEDDWPVIGTPCENDGGHAEVVAYDGCNPGAYGIPVMEYDKPDIGNKENKYYESCEPATSDDFTGKTLGLQWQWNANPQCGWYECTDAGLRLNAVKADGEETLSDVGNLLLQKWPAPEFTAYAKLDVIGLRDGDMAGIVNFGVDYGALAVKNVGGRLEVVAIEGEQHFEKERATATEERHCVGLGEHGNESGFVWFSCQVQRTGTRVINDIEKNVPVELVTLSYSTDGTHFHKVLQFQGTAGRWVGAKNGVFALGEGGNGFAMVKYVRYVK
jgi:beta-xylosidase